MQITQRQSVLGFFVALLVTISLASISQVATNGVNGSFIATSSGVILLGILFATYWRGWEPSRYLAALFLTLIIAFIPIDGLNTASFTLLLLCPPLIAMVFTSPVWIIGCGVISLISLLIRAAAFNLPTDMLIVVLYTLLVAGMVCARLVLEASSREAHRERHTAELNARALRQNNIRLEEQVEARTAQLVARNEEQSRLMESQERLLRELEDQQDTIRSLSVPVIPVSATTAVVPLIGTLDPNRLKLVQRQTLAALEDLSMRRVVLDITGVPVVDSEVAQGILQVVDMARLLGSDVALVGVRPEVAQAIVSLGIDFSTLETYRDLASVLHY
jgi:rsbT co-antagonist protein RsbR